MNIRANHLLLYLCFTAISLHLNAQSEGIKVRGLVVESNGGTPIEFATIMIGNAETRQAITGTTTGPDGAFEAVAPTDNFYVEISFIGFVTQRIEEVDIQGGAADLGTVQLSENSQTLDEVIVRAEKSQTEFQLDKRVFNVGKDLTSAGGTALDVLNNVPSVNVSVEGEVSLRGSSGVQILINGKPSVLTSEQGNALGTITTDMIERIEVITNPSAKYDAEGTSGIINIVIKKDERKGVNGSATINTGIPHNHSFGLSLNRRTEKFNLFSQLGAGYRELPDDIRNINRDLVDGTEVRSDGMEYRNETFYNVILGTDYHIDPYNVLTLSGYFAYEVEDQPSLTDFGFIDENGLLASQWRREEATEATNPKWQYELQYKREFKDDEDHTLLFSALGNFFGKDQSSEFTNTTTAGNDADAEQRTRTNFSEAENTFKLDYTRPFNEQWTIETGAQYVMTDVSNDFAVSDLIDGDWVLNPDLTNVFEYDQKVLGLYGTGAYEGKKWGLKVGLRMENTSLNTLLVNTNEANRQNFTNLFPSAHTSFKVSDAFSLQAGYSRRIMRPRLWDLNPFFNIRNDFSIRVGNPDLLPEFTDSYELTSILVLGKASMNFGVFHRFTTDVVERVSTFEDNVNTVKPYNIGTNRATGVEVNAKYSPNNWLSVNGDFNYNVFNRRGAFETTSFDFDGNQWFAKVMAKFKLPAQIDFELIGQYQSAVRTIQGEMADMLFADLGLRKKILNGKGVINLSVRDIFASRIMVNEVLQPEFYLYNRRLRGRFVTLGFSFGFGKGEAMEFSGQKRF